MKTRVHKKKIASDQFSELLNGMVGAGSVNKNIVMPKMIPILEQFKRVSKILDIFTTSVLVDQLEKYKAEFTEFNCKLQEVITNVTKCFIEETDVKKYSDYYFNSFKTSKTVGDILRTCDFLSNLKKIFEFKKDDKYQYKTLLTNSSTDVPTFAFSDFNIKFVILNYKLEDKLIQLIFNIYHRLFDATYIIYTNYTKPDINVDDFSDILLSSLKELEKHPKLSRCQTAFKKIRESASLFKDNFQEYHRDFIQTRNANTILESFILDVSKNSKGSATLTREFREIMKFYRENRPPKDDKNKSIFDELQKHMDQLDGMTKNLRTREKNKKMGIEEDIIEIKEYEKTQKETSDEIIDDCDIIDTREINTNMKK